MYACSGRLIRTCIVSDRHACSCNQDSRDRSYVFQEDDVDARLVALNDVCPEAEAELLSVALYVQVGHNQRATLADGRAA